VRFTLNFKLVRVDGQLFISEPNLRYLIDSSKQRASTATPSGVKHTVALPVSATLIPLLVFYAALLCCRPQLDLDDTALCVDTGHIYGKRNDVSVTISLPSFLPSFLHTKATSGCAVRSTQPVSVTRLLQCRGLRAVRRNQGSLLFRSTDSQRCTAGAVEDIRVSGCTSS
jgi:hypothetical protein